MPATPRTLLRLCLFGGLGLGCASAPPPPVAPPSEAASIAARSGARVPKKAPTAIVLWTAALAIQAPALVSNGKDRRAEKAMRLPIRPG